MRACLFTGMLVVYVAGATSGAHAMSPPALAGVCVKVEAGESSSFQADLSCHGHPALRCQVSLRMRARQEAPGRIQALVWTVRDLRRGACDEVPDSAEQYAGIVDHVSQASLRFDVALPANDLFDLLVGTGPLYRHPIVRQPGTWNYLVHFESPGAQPGQSKVRVWVGNTSRGFSLREGQGEVEVQFATRVPLHVGGLSLSAGKVVRGRTEQRFSAALDVHAFSETVLWSNAVESDLAQSVLFSSVASVVTPGFFLFFPSLGIGTGTVVRLTPEVEAGVRLRASLHWPFIGVQMDSDCYPQRRDGKWDVIPSVVVGL